MICECGEMMFTRRKRRRVKRGRQETHRRGGGIRHRKSRRKQNQGRVAMGELGLPNEVIELILDRLPTLSLLRFTTVCTRWRDCITSRLTSLTRGPISEDWLLMITDGLHLGKLSAYNLAREQWHSIGLPVDSNNRFPFAVAADGNFVCVSDRCYRKFGTYGKVAVCDPVLKQWQELPPLRSWGVIQGMAADPVTRAVKILATNFVDSDDGAYKLTCAELYDASQNGARWKMVLPPTALLAADCESVFCRARFVFLAPDYSLFAFDVGNESWISVPTGPLPAPRRTLVRAHKKLLACDDAILLFTIEVGSEDPSSRYLVVWGLTPAMAWTEVAKAPAAVSRQFFDFVHGDGDESGHNNHDNVYVTTTMEASESVSGWHGDEDAYSQDASHGYSSSHHWTASGETHNAVFKVWAVTVGKKAIFLKHTRLPQLLLVDLARNGDARWQWVKCPHDVPRAARPFRFAL